MAEKKITVVIDGQEFVSKAADSAGGAMDGFAGKIPAWGKAIALATAAFAILSKAVGAVGDYVTGSLDAFDKYASSQVKLAAQSKLTGVSMKDMGDLVDTARQKFGLSTVNAVDLTSAVAKFSAAAGSSAKAGDLMAAALDLGAAAGQSAAQVADGLSSSLAGNDEWLNRLGLSNPGVIWEKYRVANGLAKDQMDDTTKALAIMTAIMDAGNVVSGTAAERAASGAGAQEKLNNRIDEAKIAFGQAIQPIRIFVLQGLMTVVDVGGRVALAVARVANMIGVVFTGAIEAGRSVVGGFAVALGKLTGNKELEAWGKVNANAFTDFQVQLKKLEDRYLKTGEAATDSAETQAKAIKKTAGLTEAELKKQEAAYKKIADETERLGKVLEKLFEDSKQGAIKAQVSMREAFSDSLTVSISAAAGAIQKIRDRLTEVAKTNSSEEFQRIDKASQGYLATLGLLNKAHEVSKSLDNGLPPKEGAARLQEVVTLLQEQASLEFTNSGNAEEFRKRMDLIKDLKGKIFDLTQKAAGEEISAREEAEKSEKLHLKMVSSVSNIARGALEAAQAFGMMSSDAAATLNTVITLGESIAKVAGGDMSAIPSMIASAANLISKMIGGDSARKKLIEDNTREMDRLRRELGNLSLNVTGEDFGKLQSALAEVLPQLKGGRGAANTTDLINALAKRGLGMGDIKKLADQLGIRIFSDSGALSVDGLRQLFESMGLVELGKFGQDYASQRESVTAGFGVNGTNELGQIGALGQLGGQFSSALAGVVDVNDLAGSRSRLASLFAQMNAGGLSPEQLGGLTGADFLSLITDIIGRIDNLTPNTGGGSTAGGDGTGGGTVVTSGGVVVPTKTLSDVLDGVNAQTTALAAYHIKHLDIATAHLDEAKVQTGLLMSLVENTNGLRDGGITSAVDKGLESERIALAAERGRGGSF